MTISSKTWLKSWKLTQSLKRWQFIRAGDGLYTTAVHQLSGITYNRQIYLQYCHCKKPGVLKQRIVTFADSIIQYTYNYYYVQNTKIPIFDLIDIEINHICFLTISPIQIHIIIFSTHKTLTVADLISDIITNYNTSIDATMLKLYFK